MHFRLLPMNIERETVNVIVLGLGFMFVLTTFQTTANIEKTILNTVSKEDPSFTGDGYVSLGLIYIFLAASNWFAPSLMCLVGPKHSMVIGSITYGIFVASFLLKTTWVLYISSALLGIGAAALWAGQGVYLTLNSDEVTIARNSGIFWTLMQFSLLLGNTFVFFTLHGKEYIDFGTRTAIEIVLILVAVVGTVSLLTLPDAVVNEAFRASEGPLEAFKGAAKLFTTKSMLLMSVTSLYSGYQISFYQGVYGSSIGFTNTFGVNAQQLVGLNGVVIGLGEVIGGAVFGLMGARSELFGRNQIVSLGCAVHIVGYFIIFLNLPNSSPLGSTDETSIIQSNAYLAILCSFLLGFGDSCYNTQIYSILGFMYPDNSAAAFSIFKCIQCLASAACFFLSDQVGLHYQLIFLVLLALVGTVNFCIVERSNRKIKPLEEVVQVTEL